MIRPATKYDILTIVQLGARMHSESRYQRLKYSHGKMTCTAAELVDSENAFVVIAEKDGVPVGMMAAMCTEHFFTYDFIAYDLFIYMTPEHRGGLTGPRMIAAYKAWAESKNAKVTDIGNNAGIDVGCTDKLYEHMGAHRVGAVFQFGENDGR